MSQRLDEAQIRAAGLSETATWTHPPGADDLAVLPDRPAVVLLTDADLRPVVPASCGRLRSFLRHRFAQRQEPSRRADLRQLVRRAYWRPLETAFEQRWWYWKLARWLYPSEYRRLIDFGPSWFLHVDFATRAPQIHVSERVYAMAGEFVGPFATARVAQGWLEGLWDVFDLCRFPEQLARAPRGTRCAYAEMDRCDAPCDGSVPLDAYLQRCRAAWRFVCGGHEAWIGEAERRMRGLAASQAFERAALLRDQLGFARRWAERAAPHVRRAEHWCDLILLPVSGRRRIKPLLFCRGALFDGPSSRLSGCDAAVQAWLEQTWPQREPALDPTQRMEQTWLVSRLVGPEPSDRSVLLPLEPDAAEVPDVRVAVHRAAEALASRQPASGSGRGACS